MLRKNLFSFGIKLKINTSDSGPQYFCNLFKYYATPSKQTTRLALLQTRPLTEICQKSDMRILYNARYQAQKSDHTDVFLYKNNLQNPKTLRRY